MTTEIAPAWIAIAKIHSQELCATECEWQLITTDPYGVGDPTATTSECTVPTPRQCPAFEQYVKDNG